MEMDAKVPWRQYYLDIARAISVRATCPRASVGAVIVDPRNRILATGYNGAPSGAPECREIGCLIIGNHCKRAIHAEANAVLWMPKELLGLAKGATVYVYDSLERGLACPDCISLLRNLGVALVVTSKGQTDLQDPDSSTFLSEWISDLQIRSH